MKLKRILICFTPVLFFIFSYQATADEVILDDLIVGGSQCVGNGCADGEVFGFDTMKLKSNNPQIRFEDTSNSASFPTSDWTMGVADSVLDTSIFYVNDANAGIAILKMSASASGGVALGAGSELLDNVVSVGSAGGERKITHVADGIDDTDAVNVGQFNTFTTGIETNVADDVTAFNSELVTLEGQMSDLTARLEDLVSSLGL